MLLGLKKMKRWRMVKDKKSEPIPLATGPLNSLGPPHPMHYPSEKRKLQRAMIMEKSPGTPFCPFLTCLPSEPSSANSEFFLSNSVSIPTSVSLTMKSYKPPLGTGVWASVVRGP